MFVYSEQTSRVTREALDGMSFKSPSFLRKSLVSCMYNFEVRTIGDKKWSTNAEMRSVGPSFADTIGLPCTGNTFLCIFGSRYSCQVLGLGTVR